MRIIAGLAKGRTLATPKSGTRPMTGRAKESVFSILADRLGGASVLDLYAGSGSLGLEALSRGAKDAVFVERDRVAGAAIQKNITAVGLGGSLVVATVAEAIKRLTDPFDIVFVDPPYANEDASVTRVLESLEPILSSSAIIIVHRQAKSHLDVPDFLTSVDERHYGDAVITMIERNVS